MRKILLTTVSIGLINFAVLAQDKERTYSADLDSARQQHLEKQLQRKIKQDDALISEYLPNNNLPGQTRQISQTDQSDHTGSKQAGSGQAGAIQLSQKISPLNNLYLKIEGQGAWAANRKNRSLNKPLKAKKSAGFNVGVGGYFLENTRIELEGGFINSKFSGSDNTSSSKANGNQIVFNVFSKELSKFDQAAFANEISQILPIVGISLQAKNSIASIVQSSINQFNANSNTSLRELVIQNLQANFGNSTQTQQIRGVINYVISNFQNNKDTQNLFALLTDQEAQITATTKISYKADIIPMMLNMYVDIFDFGKLKIFIGGGAGAAKIKEKASIFTNVVWPNGESTSINYSAGKKVTNFAYAAACGISIGLTNRIHTDIKYSFKDYGKTKSRMIAGNRLTGMRYRQHVASIGLRFDL